MDFVLDEIQQELKTQARAWLGERFPLEREWDEPQDDRWAELAALGWLDVVEAELGVVEEALLAEEMGYALYPGPYMATMLALPFLGADERAEVASGATKWSVEHRGWVPNLGAVDRVVAGQAAYEAIGEEAAAVDPTRPLGRLVRRGAQPVDGQEDRARLNALLAAEAVGIAQRALELGIEHAKSRVQFGKPIGTYQAISHQLANIYTDVELARSLTYWAAWGAQEHDARAELAAAAAKAFATEAAVLGCERSIQVHGGIGFTWEHPLHRFYKRALWLHGFPETPSVLREQIAEVLLGSTVGIPTAAEPTSVGR